MFSSFTRKLIFFTLPFGVRYTPILIATLSSSLASQQMIAPVARQYSSGERCSYLCTKTLVSCKRKIEGYPKKKVGLLSGLLNLFWLMDFHTTLSYATYYTKPLHLKHRTYTADLQSHYDLANQEALISIIPNLEGILDCCPRLNSLYTDQPPNITFQEGILDTVLDSLEQRYKTKMPAKKHLYKPFYVTPDALQDTLPFCCSAEQIALQKVWKMKGYRTVCSLLSQQSDEKLKDMLYNQYLYHFERSLDGQALEIVISKPLIIAFEGKFIVLEVATLSFLLYIFEKKLCKKRFPLLLHGSLLLNLLATCTAPILRMELENFALQV